jgi:hypothetical protein
MKRVYKRKLTLWYSSTVLPQRPGVYQVSGYDTRHRRGGAILYCYWNGAKWSVTCRTLEQAYACRNIQRNASRPWRGRTEP